ncbi:MAG: endolytic transglycosylase MltG [Epulopiscium sp.]|nr:endolytic transglycosylase MltG [Candidatus Epulonipiscium sp.]
MRYYKKISIFLGLLIFLLLCLLVFQIRQLVYFKQQPKVYKQFTVVKKPIPVLSKEPECDFTIQPGDTIEKMAQRLEEKDIIRRDVFLSYLQKNEIFIKGNLYKKQQRKYILEGYFFPQTYGLYFNSAPEEICEILIQPYLDWRKETKGNDDIITIASMIEKEAAIDEDRDMIAGVIANRLKEGMRLQIDATVLYALGYHKTRLNLGDLKITSPYNTYYVSDLPPGPICSPSQKSLEAALVPKEHAYFYYVVETYGQPKHTFSKTYEEHLKKVEKYKQSKIQ